MPANPSKPFEVGPSSNVSLRTSSSTTPRRKWSRWRWSHNFTRELRDYDAAFDLVGGDTLRGAFSVVRRGGKVVSIAGLPEPTTATKNLHRGAGIATLFWFLSAGLRFRAWRAGVAYRYLFMRPSGNDLEVLASLVDTKRLEVVVDQVFPFAAIAEAFAYLEKGRAKGKVVVAMG